MGHRTLGDAHRLSPQPWSAPLTSDPDSSEPAPARRRYDSPVRRRQAAETRARIVAAGVDLAHGFSRWDWRGLTVRAVAEGAEVSERTVYRHFGSERELRDAVMEQLIEEAGVDLEDLEVGSFAEHVAQTYAYLASFAVPRGDRTDPTFSEIDQRRRDALTAAVEAAAPDWSPADRRIVASVLDAFWLVPTYARLRGSWGLGPEEAMRAASWIVGLVDRALEEDHRPSSGEGDG